MIDTINLRLSNVRSYPLTKLRFEQTAKTGNTSFEIHEDTGEVIENTRIRALLHHDTGNIIPLTKRNNMYIASSHYSLSYRYNIAADCVDFDFSIPKYLYGSNIIQFIKYFDQGSDVLYNYLMGFITSFIKKISYEPISMADVSITRIDFCYNQFFASKYDALKYLDEQKKLLPKYARSTKNEATNYGTSLSYVTKRYSFKIYHKGTEFRKHDKRKLADNNVLGVNIDELQNDADRILRYEVTFRKAQLDYLFREKQLYNQYVKFFFSDATRRSFRLTNPQMYEHVLKFCERGHTYLCAPIKQFEAIQSGSVAFDYPIFNELYKFFWEYVKKFQLQCKMSIMDIVHKVDEKNAVRDMVGDKALRKKMSFNKPTIVLLAHMLQTYTLEELRKTGLMPKATFYRYQKKLKELGVVTTGKLVDVAPPSLDFQEYLHIFGRFHLK